MRGWADVGLWVAVCFLANISLHRPTCKTTFPRLTQSQAISQSIRVFITFRSRRGMTFFRNSFLYKMTVSFTMVIKRSPGGQAAGGAGGQLRNPPVKFQHERWLHLAIDQYPVCPNRAWRELWPRKWFLLDRNPWRYACGSIFSLVHVDRRRWRSILVWSRQLISDLKRYSIFWKCLRWSSLKVVSVPTSVIGGLRGSKRLAILFEPTKRSPSVYFFKSFFLPLPVYKWRRSGEEMVFLYQQFGVRRAGRSD